MGLAAPGTVACEREAADERADQPRPQQAGQPVNPVKLAAHLHTARVAAATGNKTAAEAHIKAVASDPSRAPRVCLVSVHLSTMTPRAAMRPIEGVRMSMWLDRDNFVAMVGGQQHRAMEMIDRVCVALEPLGEILAGVVNV